MHYAGCLWLLLVIVIVIVYADTWITVDASNGLTGAIVRKTRCHGQSALQIPDRRSTPQCCRTRRYGPTNSRSCTSCVGNWSATKHNASSGRKQNQRMSCAMWQKIEKKLTTKPTDSNPGAHNAHNFVVASMLRATYDQHNCLSVFHCCGTTSRRVIMQSGPRPITHIVVMQWPPSGHCSALQQLSDWAGQSTNSETPS